MRLALAFLAVCSLGFATACGRTTVPFRQGAPYATPHRIPEALLVVVPDTLEQDRYDVRVGTFPGRHTHRVRLNDAYRSETNAHLRGIFQRGVVFLEQSRFEEIQLLEEASNPTRREGRTTLDSILDSLEEENTTTARNDRRRGSDQDQRLEEADNTFIANLDARYVLIFREAHLGLVEGRPRVLFRAAFIDRDSDELLFERRYQGSGPTFTVGQNETQNSIRIAESFRLAFASPMRQLANDIAIASGAHRDFR